MMRKFAVALIATTMLVAPALAADAVKPTPAAPVAASTTAAPTATPAPQAKTTSATKTDIKTDKHLKTLEVAHHRTHHMTFAKNGKSVSHVKIAKVSKPVKAVTVAPAASSVTPAASSVSNPAVKIIKAKNLKKLKVVDRHNGNQLTVAKNSTHVNQVKTAKVSKPTKHANVGKGQVAHVVKSNKVIVN